MQDFIYRITPKVALYLWISHQYVKILPFVNVTLLHVLSLHSIMQTIQVICIINWLVDYYLMHGVITLSDMMSYDKDVSGDFYP